MYHQFNVVTNVADVPTPVLVRALGPVDGVGGAGAGAWRRAS
jgi:3-methyladenine DNA glycosylase Mpg